MQTPPGIELYLLILRRHLRFTATVVLAAVVTAVGFTYVFSERYDAHAKVLVRPREDATLARRQSNSFGYPIGVNIPVETIAQTHEDMLQSPVLLGKIVDRLHLDAPPPPPQGPALLVALERVRSKAKRWLEETVTILKYGRLLPANPRARAIEQLAKTLKARPTPDTYVMEINSEATSPELAAAIANTAAELLRDLSRDLSSRSERQFKITMEQQLAKADRRVAKARAAVESFKQRSGLIALNEEATLDLRSQAKMREELRDLESKRAGLSRLYNDSHPKIEALDSQISLVRGKLDQHLLPRLRSLPRDEARLGSLMLTLDTEEQRYRELSAQVEQARIAEANRQSLVEIVSRAPVPTSPSRPIKVLYGGIAALLATVLALAWAMIDNFLWEPVYTREQSESVLGVPTLAELPPLGAA